MTRGSTTERAERAVLPPWRCALPLMIALSGCGASENASPDAAGAPVVLDAAVETSDPRDAGASDASIGGNDTEPSCATLETLTEMPVSTAAQIRAAYEAIARSRYPWGVPALAATSNEDIVRWSSGKTFQDVFRSFPTAVHEGYHALDNAKITADGWTYYIRPDQPIAAKWLRTFSRKELTSVHPNPVPSDNYVETYLLNAQPGHSFTFVLEEFNAHVHDLAAAYCVRDSRTSSKGQTSATSARNAVYANMLFVELYLQVARTSHPPDYASIRNDSGTKDALRAMWSRALYWLEKTKNERVLEVTSGPGYPNGIVEYRAWATDKTRLNELDKLLAQ